MSLNQMITFRCCAKMLFGFMSNHREEMEAASECETGDNFMMVGASLRSLIIDLTDFIALFPRFSFCNA
jgi:hypothetical protein